MVKEKKVLNGKMREILTIMHKKGGAMTAHDISKETGFSYKTVTKYLKKLNELDIIVVRRKNGQNKNKTN
jgi:uncharacterized membrane protein